MTIFRFDGRTGTLSWPGGGASMRAACGRGGVDPIKREGDGVTPAGRFPLRWVYYRPDREAAPPTELPVRALDPGDGWCDAPADPLYNRPVRLPYPASCEALWRADRVYDLVVVLGHNDRPAVAGLGSAIFVHVAREGHAPTEGCIALALGDLRRLVATARRGDFLDIR